jgi:hypothetical protein
MNMRGYMLAVTSILFAAGALSTAAAQPVETPKQDRCFFVNQFENWRAPDNKTLIIRVNQSRFFRLDLAQDCPELKWPEAHLVMNVRGPDTICTAVDWDLKVSTDTGLHGMAVPCIVKTMTELSPAEIDAIPKKFKP